MQIPVFESLGNEEDLNFSRPRWYLPIRWSWNELRKV